MNRRVGRWHRGRARCWTEARLRSVCRGRLRTTTARVVAARERRGFAPSHSRIYTALCLIGFGSSRASASVSTSVRYARAGNDERLRSTAACPHPGREERQPHVCHAGLFPPPNRCVTVCACVTSPPSLPSRTSPVVCFNSVHNMFDSMRLLLKCYIRDGLFAIRNAPVWTPSMAFLI